MEQNMIKKQLRQYAAACNKLIPEEKEARIQHLLQIEGQKKNSKGTLWTFIWEQIGYLGRYCLLWQTAWVVLFYYVMHGGVAKLIGEAAENGMLVAIAILSPLLVLLTVEGVTKIYHKSMLEIEYATKYSLRSAVMIRMSVLCVTHFLILTVCVICMHSRLESNTGKLLIYGLTPMVLVTGILLKLMQSYQGDLLRGAAVSIYLFTAALAVIGNTKYFGWYQPAYFKVWCIACAAGIAFDIRQFMCLNTKLENYEQIVAQK